MRNEGMTGAEALLKALAGMGVERIYASPGSDWSPVWEALARSRPAGEVPEYISSRHEETSVAMANGDAKTTGKLPAVRIHTTVGALHAGMALRIALHEKVPMVVLAGESIAFAESPEAFVGRQWLRLLADTGGPARLIDSCVKWSFGLNTPELLWSSVQRACQLAMSAPRGPAFLSVPYEYLLGPAQAGGGAALPSPPAPDARALDELASALCAAKDPLILTEEAGRDPACVGLLVSLAEALGARVVEAWQPYYFNFPRSHPLYGGIVTDDIAAVVGESDAVLLAECVLPWHPASALPKGNTPVWAIGEDPLRSRLPYWGVPTDRILPGDFKAALSGLLDRVQRKPRASKSRIGPGRAESPASDAGDVLDTRRAAHELNDVLPKGSIVVNETITHRLDLLRGLTRLEPGGWFEASFGGLGVGIGAALGVKHARPDRTVAVTIGDGAFHYNPVVASFGAAQEHGLPILVVLFNNSGYLSQKNDVFTHFPQGEAAKQGRVVGTRIAPAPDYPALARAYGGAGERVEKAGQLRGALERGLQATAKGQLALVEVVLKPV